jgi:predicted ATPase
VALARGELRSGRELASASLREAEDAGRVVEIGVARRGLGLMCYFAGDFAEARFHCERALEACDPQYGQEVRERFGDDTAVLAMSVLAVVFWQLGEVERARELIDLANRRAAELGHVPSMVHALFWKLILEVLRGNAAAALTAAEALEAFCRQHGIAYWRVLAELYVGWARGRLGDPAGGAAELRRALADFTDRGGNVSMAFFQGLLAELEAETLGAESALARIGEALALADEVEYRNSLAFVYRLRGDILLKHDPTNPTPAAEAYRGAIGIAKQQGARSHELLAALSLAKLYQSTGRPANAHAVLAPALEGFSPTPEMPQIAEAQALLAALAEEVRVEATRRRMTQIRVAYGNALLHGQGMSSPETTAAFAKASALAGTVADSAERLSIYYGLWVGPFIRGDLASMREAAETFLADAERRSDLGEAGIAHRLMGTTCWYAGDYLSARPHLDKALAAYDHNSDRGISASFGYDEGVPTKFRLGMALWALGEIDRGARLVDDSLSLALQGEHVPTIALASYYMVVFAVIRREPDMATPHAQALLDLDRRHGLPDWRAFAKFHLAWAARRSDPEALVEMRAALALQRERDFLVELPLFGAWLAETEAEAGEMESALNTIDEQVALIGRTGQRWYEAEANRIRGEILLKLDPANVSVAEHALANAVAVARGQGACSFELRAALSLAKLYQSTGRPANAHAVLTPALEGFAPRREMPEIAEAQALLAALAQSDEVKADLAQRERLLHLQSAYGQAILWSKGWGADETRDAFERTRDLASRAGLPGERFSAEFGRAVWSLLHGEIHDYWDIAIRFVQDAEREGRTPELGVGRRMLGLACMYLGELGEARRQLEMALASYVPEREESTKEKFANDTGVASRLFLAWTLWFLGDVEGALRLVEDGLRLAREMNHLPTTTHALVFKMLIGTARNDAAGVAVDAASLSDVSQRHGMEYVGMLSRVLLCWARARLGDAGADELCAALEAYRSRGNRLYVPWFLGLLAEVEPPLDSSHRDQELIDEAFTTAQHGGQHVWDSFLHRVRGDIFSKRDPADPASAEDAYRTAIAVAKRQGARSVGLQAALSLAKLYQSTGRPANAHAVLAPALEGFSPTPEMPEIAEAQAVLAALAERREGSST